MTVAAVAVDAVSKRFGAVTVLDRISLSIRSGEFYSLLGPSGCGKTTLLRMIAGFEFPSEGKVVIDGMDVSRVPAHRRPVNMVFQSYALFPHLSVFDNVAFGLRVKGGRAKPEIERQVKSALGLVRLEHLSERFPRELSGGQQQRVAFARAIVNKPRVLLLDEPLSALDPKIRQEMQGELARFRRELDTTFVMVTHDQSEAFGLSDRIAVLSAGKIEQIGTPEEIFARPRTAFVADFIGRTNLIQARVLSAEGAICTVETAGGIRILASWQDPCPPVGADVTVWVRTSAVEIVGPASEPPGGNLNCIPAEVLHRSFQGEYCDYGLKIGADTLLVASMSGPGPSFSAGESVMAVFSAEAARVLAAPTPSGQAETLLRVAGS